MPEKTLKFYNLSLQERRSWVAEQAGLSVEDVEILSGLGGLSAEQADHMIENVVGMYAPAAGHRPELSWSTGARCWCRW